MIIGLTGGIGSGKSTVAKFFTALNYPVYNSDKAAKTIYFIPEIKEKIISVLGKEAYLNETNLNKKYISDKLFNDKKLLEKINAIIHPAVGKDFKQFEKSNIEHKYIIKETALLFEAGLNKSVDKIILVTAPLGMKISRIKKRDGLSEQEILLKINNQWPDDEKAVKSDFIIYNNEIQAITPQILTIHKLLQDC